MKRTVLFSGDMSAPGSIADDRLEPDPVIETYKIHVDRSLIREQLARSIDERIHNMIAALRFAERLREAGERRPSS
jgi:hypothetical protein